ncbi:Dephospho-CoA kinase [Clostridiaceae bacterium JG1575]|nr:Dephospho-CoA kinase [Clostridiaceae bacterium JG1575]
MRQNKLKVLGITGGMGAGKSTVSHRLEEKGLLVVDADMVVSDVLEEVPEVSGYIKEQWGEAAFDDKGRLDRRSFARLLFQDEEKLRAYEAFLFPILIEEIKDRLGFIEEVTEDEWAVLDAPLLFRAPKQGLYDVSITVEAPEALALARIKARGDLSEEEAKERMLLQMTMDERKERADYVIENTGSLKQLEEAVDRLLEEINQRGVHEETTECSAQK